MDNFCENFSLKGKTVVLTGGAGLYGMCIARAVMNAGAKVFVASSNLENLEKAAQTLRGEGGDVTALQLDLADEASILALCDEVYKRAGVVDVLINNAVARPVKSFDGPSADFERSMHINATGTFLISRAFGNKMAQRGKGSIINISSIQGHVGPEPALYEGLPMNGMIPDYYFHKGGLVQLTRFLASYYGKSGVRCNAVAPGGFVTENHLPEFIKRYSAKTMLGRMAGPEDIQGIIVFLASDASAYITGVDIPVDGGYLNK